MGFEALAKSWPRTPRVRLFLARAEARLASVADKQGRSADAASLREQVRARLATARSEGSDDPNLAEIETEITPPSVGKN